MFGSYEFNGLGEYMAGVKYIDINALEHYTKCMKKYINMKIDLKTKHSTTCPNCGAPITSSKCEYCRTDFEQSMLWGNVR